MVLKRADSARFESYCSLLSVTITAPPEILSLPAATGKLRPVGEVTITLLIEPSGPFMTWLTLPSIVPSLPLTACPVEIPAMLDAPSAPAPATTAAFASAAPPVVPVAAALPGLALAIPVAEAFGGVAPATALFALAFSSAFAEALAAG